MNNIFSRQVELALFHSRRLQPKCFLVTFLLPNISMFKSTKWSHKFLTVNAAISLSNLIFGAENVTHVSSNVSLIRVVSFRSLSKISLNVE